MAFWRILPHANICAASGRLVLLDVRQDRYFLVPPSAESAMRSWLDCAHAASPPAAVRTLLCRAGTVRAWDPEPTNALKERVTVPVALDCGLPNEDRGMTAGPWRIAAILALTLAKLRLQSLHAILSEHACRRVACTGADTAPALGQAAAFAGSRSLAPFARNCLLDSLALDRWLTARGLAAMLVFGVKLDPFEAHCWLQVRNAILNDSYDHVSRFTPILAV